MASLLESALCVCFVAVQLLSTCDWASFPYAFYSFPYAFYSFIKKKNLLLEYMCEEDFFLLFLCHLVLE